MINDIEIIPKFPNLSQTVLKWQIYRWWKLIKFSHTLANMLTKLIWKYFVGPKTGSWKKMYYKKNLLKNSQFFQIFYIKTTIFFVNRDKCLFILVSNMQEGFIEIIIWLLECLHNYILILGDIAEPCLTLFAKVIK